MSNKEKSLFDARQRKLAQDIDVISQQETQRRSELAEYKATSDKLTETLKLLQREVDLTQNLYQQRVVPEIEFLRVQSRAFLFTASAVPAAVGAAQAALRIVRTAEGRELMAKVLANARLWSDGLVERGFKVVRHGDLVTPIVPVLVEDDWKAGLLWKALYDAGVFVNTALHPAVPPGGALLRTSVMATHDTPTLERALDAFASVKASFEAEHGPLPGPAAG